MEILSLSSLDQLLKESYSLLAEVVEVLMAVQVVVDKQVEVQVV
jgi:hypothetical protein